MCLIHITRVGKIAHKKRGLDAQKTRAFATGVRNTMSLKVVAVKQAIKSAHSSMGLNSVRARKPIQNVYTKEQEDLGLIKASEYVVVTGKEFIHKFDKGDHGPWWETNVYEDLEGLVFSIYKDSIKGDIAFYPTAITSMYKGPPEKYIREGNYEKWLAARSRTEDLLSKRLNDYLGSYVFRFLKLLS